MPLVTLSIKADLDGLTKLQPKDMDYAWALRVRCANCNEEHDSLVYIQNGQTFEIQGSRGQAHCIVRCRLCERVSYMNLLPDTIEPYEDSGNFAPFVSFDCRGLTPVSWEPSPGLIAYSPDDDERAFAVTIEDGDFVEFNEASGESVGVYGLESLVSSGARR